MHFDLAEWFKWFVALLPSLKSVSEWLKTGLDTTKAGLDVFKQGQELLKKEDDKQALERAKVNAELLRSYTGLGWIEFFVWFTKTMTYYIPLLIAFRYFLKVIEPRRERK